MTAYALSSERSTAMATRRLAVGEVEREGERTQRAGSGGTGRSGSDWYGCFEFILIKETGNLGNFSLVYSGLWLTLEERIKSWASWP